MKIEEKRAVSIRYKIKNSKGEVLENSIDGPSITYLQGSGKILPSLEAELLGLEAGDEKIILISKDQGYEETQDDFTVEVIIDEVRKATEEELVYRQLYLPASNSYCGADCKC